MIRRQFIYIIIISFPLICLSLTLLVELDIVIKSQGNSNYHLCKLTKLEIRRIAAQNMVSSRPASKQVTFGNMKKAQERQLCHPLMFWSQLKLHLSDWGKFYSVSKLRPRHTFLMKTSTSSSHVFKAKKGQSEANSASFSWTTTTKFLVILFQALSKNSILSLA